MRLLPRMKPAIRWIVALAVAPACLGSGIAQQENAPPSTPGPVSATSKTATPPVTAAAGKASKQVKVICDDQEVRLAFSTFADTVDRDFRQLIRENGGWAYPITVIVKGALTDPESGPTTANRIDLLPDNQFSLQLGIRLSSGFRREEASRELLRVMLFERMLRPYQSNPEEVAGKTIDTPPWLLYGIDELMKHRRSGRPSSFYAGIIQSRQVISAREILHGDPSKMDSLTGKVHNASSAALIGALLAQPQGYQHFQEFLGDLAGTGPEEMESLLRLHFPGLRGSSGALEKWWSLQVAHMGQKQAFEFLSVEETRALLAEALAVRFGVEPEEDPQGLVGKFLPRVRPGQPFEGRIHDFEKFIGRRDAARVLGENRVKLRNLSMQCFPLYRNIIARYEAVVLLLIQQRKRGIRAELDSIDRAREGADATMSRVADYMNYYEATQAEGSSQAFNNYRETRRKIEKRRRPDRKDRISRYLDALELEFREPGSP